MLGHIVLPLHNMDYHIFVHRQCLLYTIQLLIDDIGLIIYVRRCMLVVPRIDDVLTTTGSVVG